MIPITKNIIVVDEFGNEYEPTYTKRAKGLVKHGRARFISDNRICLTRSPVEVYDNVRITNSEDKSVENNINNNAGSEQSGKNVQVTVAEILSRIDKIINDTAYLERFCDSWRIASENNESVMGMQQVVLARETTNQRMIELLERMYDDISPTRNEEPWNIKAFKAFMDGIQDFDVDLETVLIGGPFGNGALQHFFGNSAPKVVNNYAPEPPRSAKPPKNSKRGRQSNNNGGFPFGNNFSDIVHNAVQQAFNSANDDFDDEETDFDEDPNN
ncbi:MAG: hypothetical protein LBN43_06420 [Oscillospiraceae bacterium]|nr:hypothetical protein [Oscillospiraceae bacterium]